MGTLSHLTPGEYSQTFNDFLKHVVEAQGGRATERWAEKHLPDARGRSYWGKLLRGSQSMTTEDIALLARWLEMTPYEFVAAVRDYAAVGGTTDDEPTPVSDKEEQEKRQSDLTLAARRGRRK